MQNALPYGFIDELTEFLKRMFEKYQKSDIQDLKLSRTTASRISKHCIAPALKKETYEDLTLYPFS
ncbi:MAG TPA: hypothetical protein PLS50_08445, partial [Candidatus Dojkabacteria bacterium]|nr:hypothetical protein [Candidatus Dojkabacteria bacterium]